MNETSLEVASNSCVLPIKILCGCGQKYAFDVEPVGGRMGYSVQCPGCGADGTAAANQVIAQLLSAGTTPAPGLRIVESELPPAVQIPLPPRLGGTTQAAGSPGRKKLLVPAIGGAFVLVLVVAGAVLFPRSHGVKHEPASPIAAANDGLPHTLEDLNAWYVEPPTGQNAATFYRQGFDAMQPGNPAAPNLPLLGKGKLPPLGAPLSAPVKSALAALVQSNKEALQLFAQGAQYEQSRYSLDLTLGPYTAFPHLPKVKGAMLLAELSAIWHAEGKDGKEAANDVLLALGLARSLEAEPSLISQLVRVTSVSTAVGALEQTLNRIAVPPESLSDLLRAFQKMEEYDARGEGFNRAAAAERATWMTLVATPQRLLSALTAPGTDIPAAQREQMEERLQKGDGLKEEQRYYEETFQQLRTARREAFPQRLKADDLVRQRVADAAGQKLVIVGLLLPGLAGQSAREAACLAHSRLGLTAVALEQSRAAHGLRYPDALSELAPAYLTATPLDPFDGQPLRYHTKGSGYVLYSIGPDLKDDSGERMNGKAGDIVFTVVARAKIP